VTFVKIEVASVDSILLDVHSLVEQQLLQTVIELLLLKQLLKLLLQMHHIHSFEFNTQIRKIPVEMFDVGVQGLRVVYYERVGSEIIDQLFSHLAVGHDHKLLNYLLTLYPLL